MSVKFDTFYHHIFSLNEKMKFGLSSFFDGILLKLSATIFSCKLSLFDLTKNGEQFVMHWRCASLQLGQISWRCGSLCALLGKWAVLPFFVERLKIWPHTHEPAQYKVYIINWASMTLPKLLSSKLFYMQWINFLWSHPMMQLLSSGFFFQVSSWWYYHPILARQNG